MSASGGTARRRVVVFTRWPEPGRTKTRLIPALGAAGASELHRELAEHALCRACAAGEPVEVRFDGCDEARMRTWLGGAARLRPQGPGDLGERLERAFADAFLEGAEAAAAIGTDCPDCSAGDVRDAFAALAGADVVFGPAADGGYWLVGLRRAAWPAAAAVFRDVAWGGPDVLRAGEEGAARAGLASCRLRTLADVDRPADLAVWERAREAEGASAVSVVVPALNEAARIGPLVEGLVREPGVEVVVADGGSTDGTPALAAAAGARVVAAPRGRALQMNAGAAAATGDILLFLHADTRLPEGFAGMLRGALADPGVGGGAFSFATDGAGWAYRVIERGADARARHLGMVYGDQGIFARRAAFAAAGGFPAQPILEDWELVRRLRRIGSFLLLDARAVTSARRWCEQGLLRTWLLNAATAAAYRCGVPPARLARWYRLLSGPTGGPGGRPPGRRG